MDMKKASALKAELAETIRIQIAEFERKTDLCVENVDIVRHVALGADGKKELANMAEVNLVCRLK